MPLMVLVSPRRFAQPRREGAKCRCAVGVVMGGARSSQFPVRSSLLGVVVLKWSWLGRGESEIWGRKVLLGEDVLQLAVIDRVLCSTPRLPTRGPNGNLELWELAGANSNGSGAAKRGGWTRDKGPGRECFDWRRGEQVVFWASYSASGFVWLLIGSSGTRIATRDSSGNATRRVRYTLSTGSWRETEGVTVRKRCLLAGILICCCAGARPKGGTRDWVAMPLWI